MIVVIIVAALVVLYRRRSCVVRRRSRRARDLASRAPPCPKSWSPKCPRARRSVTWRPSNARLGLVALGLRSGALDLGRRELQRGPARRR